MFFLSRFWAGIVDFSFRVLERNDLGGAEFERKILNYRWRLPNGQTKSIQDFHCDLKHRRGCEANLNSQRLANQFQARKFLIRWKYLKFAFSVPRNPDDGSTSDVTTPGIDASTLPSILKPLESSSSSSKTPELSKASEQAVQNPPEFWILFTGYFMQLSIFLCILFFLFFLCLFVCFFSFLRITICHWEISKPKYCSSIWTRPSLGKMKGGGMKNNKTGAESGFS